LGVARLRESALSVRGNLRRRKAQTWHAARNKAANFERAETAEELRKLASGIRERTTDSPLQRVTSGASSKDAVKG
jgi:hypothetical protein